MWSARYSTTPPFSFSFLMDTFISCRDLLAASFSRRRHRPLGQLRDALQEQPPPPVASSPPAAGLRLAITMRQKGRDQPHLVHAGAARLERPDARAADERM